MVVDAGHGFGDGDGRNGRLGKSKATYGSQRIGEGDRMQVVTIAKCKWPYDAHGIGHVDSGQTYALEKRVFFDVIHRIAKVDCG